MDRTDRLYALVEQLRAAAPRPCAPAELARRLDVTTRELAADVRLLRQAGVPVRLVGGRSAGYALDRSPGPAPLALTPSQVAAVAAALSGTAAPPDDPGARAALAGLVAALATADPETARTLAERVRLLSQAPVPAASAVPVVLEDAIDRGLVVAVDYADGEGTATRRVVEPVAVVGRAGHWYLIGWCRLRDDMRSFRLDRIQRALTTGEPAPVRDLDEVLGEIPDLWACTPPLAV